MKSLLMVGVLSASAAMVGCGASLHVADLGKIHIEILPQAEVQRRCAGLGAGPPPAVAYSMIAPTLGCAQWQGGEAIVYSIDSAGVLLHELDHAVNQKKCHTVGGIPAHCKTWGKKP